jgi:hypothetical protein
VRRKLAALGVALAVVALTSGAVFAASKVIPNDGVFYACYDSGGNVKFIDYSATQTCPKSWTGPVTWNQSGLIGIHSLNATGGWDDTADFRVPSSPSEVSMFVETGSTSQQCLATLNELRADSNVEMLFCSPRTVTFDGGATLVAGLWFHVFFAADPGKDLSLWINAYQEGAAMVWGMPRYCWDENGC